MDEVMDEVMVEVIGEWVNIKLHTILTFSNQVTKKGTKHKFWKTISVPALGGGSPSSSLTETICENFGPIFPIIKW